MMMMTNTESDLDKITKSWAASFTEEVLQYAKPATVNDMEVGRLSLTDCFIVVMPPRCLLTYTTA